MGCRLCHNSFSFFIVDIYHSVVDIYINPLCLQWTLILLVCMICTLHWLLSFAGFQTVRGKMKLYLLPALRILENEFAISISFKLTLPL